MRRTKTPAQGAHEIWPRLVVTAESRGVITRMTRAKRFGITGQVLKNVHLILMPLESYCRHHALPPLYALIVQHDSDLPGSAIQLHHRSTRRRCLPIPGGTDRRSVRAQMSSQQP